jgi:hypothetical protein
MSVDPASRKAEFDWFQWSNCSGAMHEAGPFADVISCATAEHARQVQCLRQPQNRDEAEHYLHRQFYRCDRSVWKVTRRRQIQG